MNGGRERKSSWRCSLLPSNYIPLLSLLPSKQASMSPSVTRPHSLASLDSHLSAECKARTPSAMKVRSLSSLSSRLLLESLSLTLLLPLFSSLSGSWKAHDGNPWNRVSRWRFVLFFHHLSGPIFLSSASIENSNADRPPDETLSFRQNLGMPHQSLFPLSHAKFTIPHPSSLGNVDSWANGTAETTSFELHKGQEGGVIDLSRGLQ